MGRFLFVYNIASLILNNTTDNAKVMPVKATDDNGTVSMQNLCNEIKIRDIGIDVIVSFVFVPPI